MYHLYKTPKNLYYWHLPTSGATFPGDKNPVEAYYLILRKGATFRVVQKDDTLLARVRSLSELRADYPEYFI